MQDNNLTAKKKSAIDFKLIIPEGIWEKIMYFVHRSKVEVSGLGALEWDEKRNAYVVVDAYCLDEGDSSESEVPADAFNRAAYLMRNHQHGAKWHWHSHHTMGAFWSGTDMELIRGLGHNGWIIATVFNQKNEFKTAFCTLAQVMGKDHEILVEDLPTEIDRPPLDQTLVDQWEAEYLAAAESGKKRKAEAKRYEPPKRSTGAIVPLGEKKSASYTNQQWDSLKQAWTTLDSGGYDEDGFMKDPLDPRSYKYNPLKDTALRGDLQKWEACLDLAKEEFEDLMATDPEFRAFMHNFTNMPLVGV